MLQNVFLVMIVYFGGAPPEEVWVGLRGFESPLVHLLGLVYDACCLLAFVVLWGAGMVHANWLCQATNSGNLASCFLNVAHLNPGKIDAFAWVDFW